MKKLLFKNTNIIALNYKNFLCSYYTNNIYSTYDIKKMFITSNRKNTNYKAKNLKEEIEFYDTSNDLQLYNSVSKSEFDSKGQFRIFKVDTKTYYTCYKVYLIIISSYCLIAYFYYKITKRMLESYNKKSNNIINNINNEISADNKNSADNEINKKAQNKKINITIVSFKLIILSSIVFSLFYYLTLILISLSTRVVKNIYLLNDGKRILVNGLLKSYIMDIKDFVLLTPDNTSYEEYSMFSKHALGFKYKNKLYYMSRYSSLYNRSVLKMIGKNRYINII